MIATAEASAPAKIILLGEHAVVYGQPAIAVPVSSLRAAARALPAEDGGGTRIIAVEATGALAAAVGQQAMDEAFVALLEQMQARLAQPLPNLIVELRSSIPIASGLGSGAAVSAAIARAVSAALGQPFDNAALNELVYETEKLHHGNPSGIDNTVVVYEQPVYFVRGLPIEPITIGAPLHFVIGDTGQASLTRLAIAAVRELFDREPERIGGILEQISALVKAGRAAIETGDAAALGEQMTQNHALLQALTVASPELDRLVAAALEAGAFGAKLSGGGRGGNMIALVSPEAQPQVETALRAAGAARSYTTTVSSQRES